MWRSHIGSAESMFMACVYRYNGAEGNEMLVGSLSCWEYKINIGDLIKCGDTDSIQSIPDHKPRAFQNNCISLWLAGSVLEWINPFYVLIFSVLQYCSSLLTFHQKHPELACFAVLDLEPSLGRNFKCIERLIECLSFEEVLQLKLETKYFDLNFLLSIKHLYLL